MTSICNQLGDSPPPYASRSGGCVVVAWPFIVDVDVDSICMYEWGQRVSTKFQLIRLFGNELELELEPSNTKYVCILLPVSRTRHRTTGAMHPSRRIDHDDVTGQEFRLYRSDARGENPVRTLPTRPQCACEGVVDDNDGYYDNEERAQSVSGGRTARDVRGTRVEQRGSEA